MTVETEATGSPCSAETPGAAYRAITAATEEAYIDLADHADLRELAGQWRGRVDVVSATIDEPPADALLILPHARIAWSATVDEPGQTALPALREALTTSFGAPST